MNFLTIIGAIHGRVQNFCPTLIIIVISRGYLWALEATLSFGFFVRNIGEAAAANVMVRMEVPSKSGYTLLGEPVKMRANMMSQVTTG